MPNDSFVLPGHVESGLPEFKPPPFESRVGNETYGFIDMASKLGSGILVVPLLSILENISLAKFFGRYFQKKKKKITSDFPTIFIRFYYPSISTVYGTFLTKQHVPYANGVDHVVRYDSFENKKKSEIVGEYNITVCIIFVKLTERPWTPLKKCSHWVLAI